jgi:2-methylisocitrate lyase-like PEP mutase family enzyme
MHTTRTLRELLDAPGLAVLPGAYDALSARIIEAEGFPALVAGGYAAIGSMLAEADMGQSNLRDYADHYARICDAVQIPVYVDGDTGFGGVHNVARMVRAFESAGVAGLFFSDQVFPNRCGYLPGKQVVSPEEMLARLGAALDARRDAEVLIVGRTDCYAAEGLDAAIERCQLMVEAGADLAKPQGVDTPAEIARVISEVPGAHIATLSQAAGAAAVSLSELAALGTSAVTLPSVTLFAAAHAVRGVLGALRTTGDLDSTAGALLDLEDYYRLVGLSSLLEREERYDAAAHEIVTRAAFSR